MARTRSIDRFSTAMRVLARREPVNRRDARLVVQPARPADAARMVVPARRTLAEAPAAAVSDAGPAGRKPSTAARRAAARAAARRRRRILAVLLVADLVTVLVAAFALAPWWSVAVPVTLTVLYLVLIRTQVRRDNDASWNRELVAPRPARDLDEVSADEDTVAISTVAVAAGLAASSPEEADLAAAHALQFETVAVSVPTADGGSLWDPLPVTLPTYVSKPRAARTVRTINLDDPDTWTSGRTEADSRLVEEASAAADEAAPEQDERRAVGS